MTVKVLLRGVLSLILSVVLLTGCGGPKTPRLYIYNWTSYMKDEVLREFEKRYNVKVVYDMFSSNEEMFAKLKAGGTGYDIVVPSGDYVSIMIKEGMLAPLDHGRLPTMAHLDTAVLNKIHFDEGNRYSIPYMLGTSGIIVNTEKVPSFEKSWNIFGRQDLAGRMTMLDDMREVMGGALRTLGYSVNSTDREEIYAAKQVVAGWANHLIKFDAESFGKGFAAGEFWVVQGYPENVFAEIDSAMRAKTEFFVPREGGAMYVDNLVILKDARNKELAHTFISFIHEPEVYAQLADHLGYPSINESARSLTKNTPNYEIDDLAQGEFKEDLGEVLEIYNQAWQEIRIGK